MCPHNEGQEAQHQYRANHDFIAPEWAASVIGHDLRDYADGRQNEHIHLRMTKEPEQVLP